MRGAFFERGDVKEILTHPVLGPMLFDCGGVVGFWQVVRHGSFRVTKRGTAEDKGQTTTDNNRQLQTDGSAAVVVCFCRLLSAVVSLERIQLVEAFLLLVCTGRFGALVGLHLGVLLGFLARGGSTCLHLRSTRGSTARIIDRLLAFGRLLHWRQRCSVRRTDCLQPIVIAGRCGRVAAGRRRGSGGRRSSSGCGVAAVVVDCIAIRIQNLDTEARPTGSATLRIRYSGIA